MRSCTDCEHFRFEVRTIRGKELRGYWCGHYPQCKAQKPEAVFWEHDPTKRRFWNSYVRRSR